MSSRIPTQLYRYRSFDSRALESLCGDHLFFSSPSNFNDPLDCKPTITADSPLPTLRNLLKLLIQRRIAAETTNSLGRARIQGEKARAYAQRRAAEDASSDLARIRYDATNPEFEGTKEEAESWMLTNQIREEMMRHYDKGVCCFSSVYNSPLLWSHYADQHKGICIGYGLDRNPRPVVHKVLYGGSRRVSTSTIFGALAQNEPEAKSELDRDVLLRKAPGWKYEREWRLIGAQGLQDSCVRLESVTFGLRCPDAVRHAVVLALHGRSNHTKFYEIHESSGTFRLRRRQTDVSELQGYLPRTAESAQEAFPDDWGQ